MGGIANTISYWGSMVHKTGLDFDLELIVKLLGLLVPEQRKVPGTDWTGCGDDTGREHQQWEAVWAGLAGGSGGVLKARPCGHLQGLGSHVENQALNPDPRMGSAGGGVCESPQIAHKAV